MIEVLWWLIIAALFIISIIMLKYPWIPGVLFLFGGYVVYGFAFSFEPLGWWFWGIQLVMAIGLYLTEIVATGMALKVHGGSKLALRGSLIGMIAGPFVIPVAGLVIGPFIGAVLAEWLFNKRTFRNAVQIGLGSLIGLFGSILLKALIQTVMFVVFVMWVLFV